MPRLLITLFFLPLLVLGADEPKLMRVPVKFRDAGNLAFQGGLVRIRREWRQEGAKPIVFEAEAATVLEHHSRDDRILPREDCSGGYAVAFVKEMAFHFEVETPGEYEVRLRAWFPRKGNWNHNEQMDDGSRHNVVDSFNRDTEIWWWTEGPTYTLDKGKHVYLYPSPTAWCGGCLLDKVVLFPKGQAQGVSGMGPAQSPFATPSEAEAVSWRTKLKRIRRWKMEYDVTDNGGTARIDYGWSSQGPWETVEPGKLNDLPDPKPRYIYFRFRLEAAEGQPSPFIEGLQFLIEKEPRT